MTSSPSPPSKCRDHVLPGRPDFPARFPVLFHGDPNRECPCGHHDHVDRPRDIQRLGELCNSMRRHVFPVDLKPPTIVFILPTTTRCGRRIRPGNAYIQRRPRSRIGFAVHRSGFIILILRSPVDLNLIELPRSLDDIQPPITIKIRQDCILDPGDRTDRDR